MTTSDPSVSPVLDEIRIGYLAPATTTIPDTTTTSTVEPTTSIPTPSCAGVAPASADQGATLDVTITGADTSFVEGLAIAFFICTGITVNSTLVTSPAQAVANITIAADAPVGACDVTVTTGTEIVTCTAAFTITAASPAKDITAFSILGIAGTIGTDTIAVTVPYGTDPSSLTPTITHTGASVNPASGAPHDF